MSKNPKLYRPNVGIMLLNQDNQVFVAQRSDSKEPAWQMPQGGVDEGESLEQAAFRELKEEIGTANATIIGQTEDWYFYDLPKHLQKKMSKIWGGKYLGQRQKWVFMRFLGDDNEIDLNSDLAGNNHQEFTTWKWVDISELPDLAISFKRDTYKSLVEHIQTDLSIE